MSSLSQAVVRVAIGTDGEIKVITGGREVPESALAAAMAAGAVAAVAATALLRLAGEFPPDRTTGSDRSPA